MKRTAVAGKKWLVFTSLPVVLPLMFVFVLSPRWAAQDILLRVRSPLYFPWDFPMRGHSLGDRIESNLVLNLSDPSEVQDTSWTQPGRSARGHWRSDE